MKIIADTNVLVRVAVKDDREQAEVAALCFERAELIAVPLVALCEFVWVLQRVYRIGASDICNAIEVLVASKKVVVDTLAVEAGLTMLKAGGDFADGAIDSLGRYLGGEIFVSFDREATRLLGASGHRVHMLN